MAVRVSVPFTQSFNPRTRVGCEELGKLEIPTGYQFQSTHPCGVRIERLGTSLYEYVSIHAPVWGANTAAYGLEDNGLVSIHAPVWGAKCVRRLCRRA